LQAAAPALGPVSCVDASCRWVDERSRGHRNMKYSWLADAEGPGRS